MNRLSKAFAEVLEKEAISWPFTRAAHIDRAQASANEGVADRTSAFNAQTQAALSRYPEDTRADVYADTKHSLLNDPSYNQQLSNIAATAKAQVPNIPEDPSQVQWIKDRKAKLAQQAHTPTQAERYAQYYNSNPAMQQYAGVADPSRQVDPSTGRVTYADNTPRILNGKQVTEAQWQTANKELAARPSQIGMPKPLTPMQKQQQAMTAYAKRHDVQDFVKSSGLTAEEAYYHAMSAAAQKAKQSDIAKKWYAMAVNSVNARKSAGKPA